jgi:hypothetical protein
MVALSADPTWADGTFNLFLHVYIQAAIKACAELNERLAPVKASLGAGATWQEVIIEANNQSIDLCAKYM